jgi:ABC-type cobalt transport system substrate-binding protein
MKELVVGLAMAIVAAVAVPTLAQTTGASPAGSDNRSESVVQALPPIGER